MDKTKTKKDAVLEVLLPDSGFPRTMFFNRFRVERQDGFTLLYLALIADSGTVDEYCCVFTADALATNKNTLLDYLNRIGLPKVAMPNWLGVTNPKRADVVDIVHMTHQGDFAETQLIMYSRVAAFRATQDKKTQSKEGPITVVGEPVSLLRSSIEAQRNLIKALYE